MTIPYLPLDAYLDTHSTAIMIPHDEHWNPEGHRVAAEAIDAFLQKVGVFGTSPQDIKAGN